MIVKACSPPARVHARKPPRHPPSARTLQPPEINGLGADCHGAAGSGNLHVAGGIQGDFLRREFHVAAGSAFHTQGFSGIIKTELVPTRSEKREANHLLVNTVILQTIRAEEPSHDDSGGEILTGKESR